jgi:glycosyltransferase involved in cell wall biosynthesis
MEARLVKRSAARVLNTPAMRASFEKYFPGGEITRNFVISNGFESSAEAPPPPESGPICLVHAGEIYTGRSLVPVLSAAARLLARHPERPVRVITYGDLPAPELARIREQQLESHLEVRPRISFSELFVELQRAHLLLAVVGEHMPYSTPYKVFDYMAAGRPILAIAPRGAALVDLMTESGAGVCIDRDDVDGIEKALEKFLHGDFVPSRARVERYRWSNLALQYRTVIEDVSGARSDPVLDEPSASSAKVIDL